MESAGKKLLKLLVERDPASPEFRSGVRAVLSSQEIAAESPSDVERDLWRDVFVQQKLPWGRFLQSALLHVATVALLYTISLAWIRQQHILDRAAFDRSSLVTYSPDEYLPPLDTGTSEAAEGAKGRSGLRQAAHPFGSAGSGQPVANHRRASRSQAGPRRCLAQHHCHRSRRASGSAGCDARAADAPGCARDAGRGARTGRAVCARPCGASGNEVGCDCAASGSDAIARAAGRSGHGGGGTASELRSTKGHVGQVDIGPSAVVGPAPQLTLAEQHALGARGARTSGRRQRATGRSSAEHGGERRERQADG